ncbi:hypothetical protein MRB53_008848 [Persea americana]|uniref:Uncharacterized protein n=1 Tax=Persea americana TaxID=3435 RepID=A0ACC2LNH7_PERAE|nr:hypothetical protein MRB53_008848 [Persea americana]
MKGKNLIWSARTRSSTISCLKFSSENILSAMLLSWASKQSWKPTFVDLDTGQGSITIPEVPNGYIFWLHVLRSQQDALGFLASNVGRQWHYLFYTGRILFLRREQ